jgi:hypothetical protein
VMEQPGKGERVCCMRRVGRIGNGFMS